MRRLAVGLGTALLLTAMVATAAGADSKKAPDGKPVFVKYKCGACHTIASQGIVKKAAAAPAATAEAKPGVRKPPDLSSVGLEHKDGWVAAFLKGKETLDGRKHMKLFRGTDAELATLAAWLETMKTEKKGAAEKSGK
jgi:mono/diheme cytochrome c family protein